MTDGRTGVSQEMMEMDINDSSVTNNSKHKRKRKAESKNSKTDILSVKKFFNSLLKDIPTDLNVVKDEKYRSFCSKQRKMFEKLIDQGLLCLQYLNVCLELTTFYKLTI